MASVHPQSGGGTQNAQHGQTGGQGQHGGSQSSGQQSGQHGSQQQGGQQKGSQQQGGQHEGGQHEGGQMSRGQGGGMQGQQSQEHAMMNVGDGERMASLIGGGLLALVGLSRMSLTNVIMIGLGASLLYRGATGHCSLYQQLGMNTHE